MQSLTDFFEHFKNKRPNPNNIVHTHRNEWEQVLALTDFLPHDAGFRQREYHITNNIFAVPLCEHCNKTTVRWNIRYNKYGSYCSNKCINESEKVKNARKNSILEKYGVVHYSQTEQFKDKFKQTSVQRYGVSHPNKRPGFANKLQKTNIARYNRVNQNMVHISQETIDLLANKQWLYSQHHENHLTLTNISNLLGDVSLQAVRTAMAKHQIPVKRFFSSMGEQQVYDTIKQLLPQHINVERRYRGFDDVGELDIWIPDLQIAIEYNGMFWHSDKIKHRNHLNDKKNACNVRGIRLIHIFEHEWLNYPEKTTDRLKNIIGANTTRIYARDTVVKRIDFSTKRDFLNDHHIQNDCSSSINYGLYKDDLLVAVATFGKPRMSTKYQYELIRYCSVRGANVVGGASKLFTHFIKNHSPDSIVSYSDRRWNTGNLYTKLGFAFSHTSNPNYWYFKTSGSKIVVLSRYQCQKHRLANILEENFDPALSEFENMNANGYGRIWDCGNDVFIWKRGSRSPLN